MNKKVVLTSIVTGLVALILIGSMLGLVIYKKTSERHTDDSRPLGVWWWDNRLDSSYLDFSEEQGVNEIYYYSSSFSQKTSDFIKDAGSRGMKVFWLQGKYEWIEDPQSLKDKMSQFLEYQNGNQYKFAGVHLDIEPHQHPQFDERREQLITAFVSLTADMKNTYPDLWIEYDIPFWLEDEITVDGVEKPAYAFIIDNASRVTMMSYRDEWENIYDVAKDEAEYASSVGKTLNFGVETGENEDDIVTFYEEGSAYMYDQLDLLRKNIPDGFGIAIHHIKDWKALKK